MTINSNSDCSKLTLEDSNIQDFITNPQNYDGATISTTINCCDNATECTITVDHSSIFCARINISKTEDTYIDELNVNDNSGGTINILSSSVVLPLGYSCNDTDLSALIAAIESGYNTNFSQAVVAYSSYDVSTGYCYICIKPHKEGDTINSPYTILGSTKSDLNFIHSFIENVTVTYSDCVSENDTDNTWELNPQGYYSLDTFQDGIYAVTITLTPIDGGENIVVTNCYSVLCNHKCTIADKIEELKSTNPDDAIKLYLVYTALINGSNCSCDCSKLCEMYEYLLILLGEINNFSCDEC